MKHSVVPLGNTRQCECKGTMESVIMKVMDMGKIVVDLPPARAIRERAMHEIAQLRKDMPAREFLNL